LVDILQGEGFWGIGFADGAAAFGAEDQLVSGELIVSDCFGDGPF